MGVAPVGAKPVGAGPVGAKPVGAGPVGAKPVGAGPVGAKLARDQGDTVQLMNRVIVHREQALLPQVQLP
ncbi:hypothetical protein B0E42_04215 [Pseudomonas sp. A25(2017)]|nr:hypothetical protein B0E42_04215 [Pseudomonas sp. A25(2017)]